MGEEIPIPDGGKSEGIASAWMGKNTFLTIQGRCVSWSQGRLDALIRGRCISPATAARGGQRGQFLSPAQWSLWARPEVSDGLDRHRPRLMCARRRGGFQSLRPVASPPFDGSCYWSPNPRHPSETAISRPVFGALPITISIARRCLVQSTGHSPAHWTQLYCMAHSELAT